MKNKDIVGINQKMEKKIEHLWVPFIATDMRTLSNKHELNFNIAVINNTMYDTGSQTYYFIKENPQVKVAKYSGKSSTDLYRKSSKELKAHGFNKDEINLIKTISKINKNLRVEFHLDNLLLHVSRSSFDDADYEKKEHCVKEFIEKICNSP